MTNQQKLSKLNSKLLKLYGDKKKSKHLLFHGWHHINFVRNKAIEFGRIIKADLFIVESAALVHDLNYFVKVYSKAKEGAGLRNKILSECGYSAAEINRIEQVILECETGTRGKNISLEGKAVCDGDTLFKALPTTPVLFASKYIAESKIDIQILADKIVKDQRKLLASGIYFYTPLAKKKYLRWAKLNLQLWGNIQESLQDKDVRELLAVAKKFGVL
jgi:uncharacterized protein